MKDYKVTNLKTNSVQFMNEKEKERFMNLNNKNENYYFAEELKEKNLIDYIPLWLIVAVMVAAFYTSILLHFQLNY